MCNTILLLLYLWTIEHAVSQLSNAMCCYVLLIDMSDYARQLVSKLRTSRQLHALINSVNDSKVENHFKKCKTPFIICEDVTEEVWNEYTKIYDDEISNIKLRFLDWEKGKVQIIDMPSPEHEYTVVAFNDVFKEASGSALPYPFAARGAVKHHHMEPDCSYGPLMPSSILPRGLSNIHEWMTFIVEVAFHTQPGRIDAKISYWLTVPGVKYVLDLRVSENCQSFSYKLYHVDRQLATVVVQSNAPIVHSQGNPPENIVIDARELLGLGANDALPRINNPVVVNLRRVVYFASMYF